MALRCARELRYYELAQEVKTGPSRRESRGAIRNNIEPVPRAQLQNGR